MAARAHFKDEKPTAGHGDKKTGTKGHPFRNALLISLALAALILWQLNPIIRGLHSIQTTLMQAENIRRVTGGLLNIGYHHVVNTVGPLIHRVAK